MSPTAIVHTASHRDQQVVWMACAHDSRRLLRAGSVRVRDFVADGGPKGEDYQAFTFVKGSNPEEGP